MTGKKREAGIGYEAIADELRSRIESGELAPGAKVPGEKELMATHGVSRDTAYRALMAIRAEGLTVGRQGAPTRVRTVERIRRRADKRLSAEVWGEGRSMWSVDVVDREPEVRDLHVDRVPAAEAVAKRLGLEVGQPVVRRARRYVLDGKPVMTAVSYIPSDLADGTRIAQDDTGEGGIYGRLKDLGHAPKSLPEEIRCRMPKVAEKAQLELAPGTPVIEIIRCAIEESGRVVEMNEMVLDASSYVLEYIVSA